MKMNNRLFVSIGNIKLLWFLLIIYLVIYATLILSYCFKSFLVGVFIILFGTLTNLLLLLIRCEFSNNELIVRREDINKNVYKRSIITIVLIIFVLSASKKILPFSLLFFAGFPVLWKVVIRNESFKALGLRKDNIKRVLLLGLLIGLFSIPILYGVFNVYFGVTFGELTRSGSFAEKILNLPNMPKYFLFFLQSFVIISLGEEIFFRGFIQMSAEKHFGKRKGVFLSCLVYFLPHLVFFKYWPIEIASIFILLVANLSFIFAILFSETKNVIPTWVAHGLIVFSMGIFVGLF